MEIGKSERVRGKAPCYMFGDCGTREDTLLCSASVARAMSISVQFSPGWYALFVAFFLAWLTLALLRRKSVGRREAKEQFVLGLLGSCALVSMEIFATSTNLWTYVPQNWPVMLWPTYFVAILFGYQLLRLVEGFFSHKTPRALATDEGM